MIFLVKPENLGFFLTLSNEPRNSESPDNFVGSRIVPRKLNFHSNLFELVCIIKIDVNAVTYCLGGISSHSIRIFDVTFI